MSGPSQEPTRQGGNSFEDVYVPPAEQFSQASVGQEGPPSVDFSDAGLSFEAFDGTKTTVSEDLPCCEPNADTATIGAPDSTPGVSPPTVTVEETTPYGATSTDSVNYEDAGLPFEGPQGEHRVSDTPPCCDPTETPSQTTAQSNPPPITVEEGPSSAGSDSVSFDSGTSTAADPIDFDEAGFDIKDNLGNSVRVEADVPPCCDPKNEPKAEERKADGPPRVTVEEKNTSHGTAEKESSAEPNTAANKDSKTTTDTKEKSFDNTGKQQTDPTPKTVHAEARQFHASVNQVRETSNRPNVQSKETASMHEPSATKGRVELPKVEVSTQRVDITSIGRIEDRRLDPKIVSPTANSIPEKREVRSAVSERTAPLALQNSQARVKRQEAAQSVRRVDVGSPTNTRYAMRESAPIGSQRGRSFSSASELRIRPSRPPARSNNAASATTSNPRTRVRLQSGAMQPTRMSRTLLREQRAVRSKALPKEQGHIRERARATRQRNNNDFRRQNRNVARDIQGRASSSLRNREIRASTRPGTTLRLARLRQEQRDGKVKVNQALVRRLNGLFKKHEQLTKSIRTRKNGGPETRMRGRQVRKVASQENPLSSKRAAALVDKGKSPNNAIARTVPKRVQSFPEKSKEIRFALRQIAIKDLPRGKSLKSLPIKVRLEVVRARHRVQALTARLRHGLLPEPLVKRLTSELSTSDLERLVAILAGSRGAKGLKKKKARGETVTYVEDDLSLAVLRDLQTEAKTGSKSNSSGGYNVDASMIDGAEGDLNEESAVVAENGSPIKTLDTVIVKDGAAANP